MKRDGETHERCAGRNGVFYALEGKCFSINIREYEYEVCPFGEAKQKQSNGVSTSLGYCLPSLCRSLASRCLLSLLCPCWVDSYLCAAQ